MTGDRSAWRARTTFVTHAVLRIMLALDTALWTAMAKKRMLNCFDALRALLHKKQTLKPLLRLVALDALRVRCLHET